MSKDSRKRRNNHDTVIVYRIEKHATSKDSPAAAIQRLKRKSGVVEAYATNGTQSRHWCWVND